MEESVTILRWIRSKVIWVQREVAILFHLQWNISDGFDFHIWWPRAHQHFQAIVFSQSLVAICQLYMITIWLSPYFILIGESVTIWRWIWSWVIWVQEEVVILLHLQWNISVGFDTHFCWPRAHHSWKPYPRRKNT